MTQKSNWDHAAEHILKVEGGYVNHPNDPGGATNWGISLRFLKDEARRNNVVYDLGDVDDDGDIDADDIKKLPVKDALAIYKEVFWNPYFYWEYPLRTALKLFDMGVNMGNVQAHRLAQRAANSMSPTDPLKVDGVFGPKTRAKILALSQKNETLFLSHLRAHQRNFYDNIISRNPKLAVFRRGWMNRVNSV